MNDTLSYRTSLFIIFYWDHLHKCKSLSLVTQFLCECVWVWVSLSKCERGKHPNTSEHDWTWMSHSYNSTTIFFCIVLSRDANHMFGYVYTHWCHIYYVLLYIYLFCYFFLKFWLRKCLLFILILLFLVNFLMSTIFD